MKRILIPGILVCVLLVWHMGRPSLADKLKSDQAAKWEPITFKSSAGKEINVSVLRIWKSAAADPKWPQLALVRLPPAAYKELWKDTKALKTFVDGAQTQKPIFDAPVTITENCKLPEPEDEKVEDDTTWLLTLSHRTSHASCSAIHEHAIGH